jgi:hypothetical protein
MKSIRLLRFSKMAALFTGMAMIVFTNCSKQNTQTETSSGYWSVGDSSHKYNINYTSRQDSLGHSVLKGSEYLPSSSHPMVNMIYIWFSKSFPVENGSYEMVNLHYPPFALSDNQIGISGIFTEAMPIPCSTYDTAFFDATGVSSILTSPWTLSDKADLTVVNGKISVVIPRTIARYYNGCVIDSPNLHLVYQEK